MNSLKSFFREKVEAINIITIKTHRLVAKYKLVKGDIGGEVVWL